MKTKLYILTMAVLMLTGCASSQFNNSSYVDDLYYSPSDTPKETVHNITTATSKEALRQEQKVERKQINTYQKNTDEYQLVTEGVDYGQVTQNYTSILEDESISDIDTLVYYNDREGEYIGGFDGDRNDFEYAERLRRFHGPNSAVVVWDPLYEDAVYDSNNYNIYVEGSYAWVTPTWRNSYYSYGYHSPYYWDSWFHDPWYYNSWGYGYGNWNRPYYGGYGFGFGYYSSYYSGVLQQLLLALLLRL